MIDTKKFILIFISLFLIMCSPKTYALENKEIYPKVVETSYGYHIIKKTGEKYVDFDEEKDSLMETLSNNKQNTLLQDALEKYNVKINI